MVTASVIIPTYNRADMVGSAVQSVLAQTLSDWELIVVDDGSQDNTRDVIAQFKDSRIRYIYQDNQKLPGARNTGIRASTGEYVAFLDSDDLFLPEKIQLQVKALDHNPEVGLIASGWTEVDAQRNPLRTRRPWLLNQGLAIQDWLYNCPFAPSAVLVRRDWLMWVGLFDAQQYYVEDWDLWLRLSYAGCRMAWEPTVVYLQTIHESNMVRNAAQMSAGLFRLFDKFFAQPKLSDDLLRQRDRVFASAHVNAAVRALGAGAVAQGTEHLAAAIRLDSTWLDDDPPAVLQSLASTALTQQVRDVERYVADVCASLPTVSSRLARSPRQFRAMIRATAAFEDFANGCRSSARRKAASALFLDWAWLRNRGLLSIMLKP